MKLITNSRQLNWSAPVSGVQSVWAEPFESHWAPTAQIKDTESMCSWSDRQTKRDYQWQGSLGVMLAAEKASNRIKGCFFFFIRNHRYLKSTEEKRAVRWSGRKERETDAENEKREGRPNECQIFLMHVQVVNNLDMHQENVKVWKGLDVTDLSVEGSDGWFSCIQCVLYLTLFLWDTAYFAGCYKSYDAH